MSSLSPVALAENLLDLVKSMHHPSPETDKDASVDAYNCKNDIARLCDELKRSVMGPLEYTVTLAESCQESSAIRFVTELGVADIIADGSMPLSEISKKTGVDIRYLQITMSCLLAHGYFEENETHGSPAYRNNAMSQVLRSGRDDTLKEAIGFICDEGFKSTSYLLEYATSGNAASGFSGHGTAKPGTAAGIALGFQGSIFKWMARSDQAWRGKRMGKAMQQLHRAANGNIGVDFDWNGLPSPIVDIGGGIGSLEMVLLEAHPESALNFIVFDIPETIENATKLWSTKSPSDQARVSFVSGDFLAPGPETGIPKGQPIYVIRHVLHDWTDEQVVTILSNVREAMLAGQCDGHSPRLLLCEMLLRRTSSRVVRTTSMQILALNNGMTRTEGHMIQLVKEAGFLVIKVHMMRAVDSVVEAMPIV